MLNSLGEVLPHAAHRFGDKTALVIERQSFSFHDLDRLSNALAGNLVKLGVKPGDRVTLYSPNSWEWIVSYYGALKTGAVINPVNVMLTPAEVAYVTKDCGAKILIGSPVENRTSLSRWCDGADDDRLRRYLCSGHDAIQRVGRQGRRIRASRSRSKGALDHRLHVRRYRPSQRRHAIASRGHSQRCNDRSVAREVEYRHGRERATLPTCLRQRSV